MKNSLSNIDALRGSAISNATVECCKMHRHRDMFKHAAHSTNMAQPKRTWLVSIFSQACWLTLLLYPDIRPSFP